VEDIIGLAYDPVLCYTVAWN